MHYALVSKISSADKQNLYWLDLPRVINANIGTLLVSKTIVAYIKNVFTNKIVCGAIIDPVLPIVEAVALSV